ncbi:NADH dehydrogenase [ubiquinone] 1 beta subcomplex subunit mitochondrial isoform 2 [Schistosoma japonicum]|uniref:NADH dehydrogenase [ubiquinone] 1 beta subcomplex subunit 11, mitochondrial n=2 Tax=Schistosoma japonicum TaxID=6182 RepID=Q5DEJ4_SCHJA|nr:unknown [Schistosoma japonicum]TNN12275.1 NADH dehydrogenase [ubiquinone] 1 beta subcomplex subunit mitochondrial isoform 2 [Schistosoma japonicum]
MASLKLSALSVSSLRNFHHIAALITPNIKRHIYTTMAVHVELNPMKHILKENNIPEAEKRQIEKEVEELTKDWTTSGYHKTDKDEDTFGSHFIPFTLFTLGTFPLLLFFLYAPDSGLTEWSHREAFLELERRRRDGLPLVDKDLVPASQVQLPSDEDLGPDFKIIL